MKQQLTPEERALKRAKWRSELKTDLKWVTAFLFVLILTGPLLLYYSNLDQLILGDHKLVGPYADWEGGPKGEEDLTNVTAEIFGTSTASAPGGEPTNLVVPFEILSVLLLAALIAGVVIALRDVETKGGR